MGEVGLSLLGGLFHSMQAEVQTLAIFLCTAMYSRAQLFSLPHHAPPLDENATVEERSHLSLGLLCRVSHGGTFVVSVYLC